MVQSAVTCPQPSPLIGRSLHTSAVMPRSLKIAVIGQSVFAKDVYNLIRKNGHTVVGVFTIPDKNGREVTSDHVTVTP